MENEGICEDCGTDEDVDYGPCPYKHELYRDATPVSLCGECAKARYRET